MITSEVVLSSTLHDQKGAFLGNIDQASRVVLQNYHGWIVNATTVTHPKVIEGLRNSGVIVTQTDPDNKIVDNKIENDHLYLLTRTLEYVRTLGTEKVQYTDGDRIFTAATYYPVDLANMATRANELVSDSRSYLNFRRSAQDYFAHHPPLVETELEFNRLYSKAFGGSVDIGSTAHGMSMDVLSQIIKRSPKMEPVSFPHPKWLIIAAEMDAELKSEETNNVLTFETPHQFLEELYLKTQGGITEAERYTQVQRAYMRTLGRDSTLSVKEWRDLRYKTQSEYLTLLKNHLRVLRLPPEEEAGLREDIDKSLNRSASKLAMIVDILEKPTDKVKRELKEQRQLLRSIRHN